MRGELAIQRVDGRCATMELVFRAGDFSPTADRFERVAVATAAAAGCLDHGPARG